MRLTREDLLIIAGMFQKSTGARICQGTADRPCDKIALTPCLSTLSVVPLVRGLRAKDAREVLNVLRAMNCICPRSSHSSDGNDYTRMWTPDAIDSRTPDWMFLPSSLPLHAFHTNGVSTSEAEMAFKEGGERVRSWLSGEVNLCLSLHGNRHPWPENRWSEFLRLARARREAVWARHSLWPKVVLLLQVFETAGLDRNASVLYAKKLLVEPLVASFRSILCTPEVICVNLAASS